MNNTSTPLSHLNTSTNPETTETSYFSATSTPNVPELIQTRKQCFSRLYKIILLLGVLLCCSLLIYLVIHAQFYLKFSGGVNSDLGNMNFTLQSEGGLNLSTKINSSVKAIPSQLWKQQYVELLLDSP